MLGLHPRIWQGRGVNFLDDSVICNLYETMGVVSMVFNKTISKIKDIHGDELSPKWW